jgi:alpha-beta hydrolase superfamily lysophospholipase
MQHREIEFSVDGETIRGTLDIADGVPKPTVLSLHGAGPSNRARAGYITEFLALRGVSSVRFDFSGHGESSGQLKGSSLENRLAQARAAARFLDQEESGQLTLIGTSMGGHVAARLCAEVRFANLVLFCPAAYAAEAESLAFGDAFSEAIRKPNSYMSSLAFRDIGKFDGNVVVVIGDSDEVIPGQVVDAFLDSAKRARTRILIRIKGAPHQIHGWLEKNGTSKSLVLEQIGAIAGPWRPAMNATDDSDLR